MGSEQHTDRRLRTVLETGQEIVWECDADGVVTFVSPNVQDYLGYTPAEIIGRTASRLLHPASLPSYCDRVAAVLAGEVAGWWHGQARWVSKDGTEVHLDSTAIAHVAQAGRVVGFGGTSRYPDANILARQRREVVRTRVLRTLMRQDLQIVFQPIVSMTTGEIIGAEALSRFPPLDTANTPDRWFAAAAEVGLGPELELLAVRKAIAIGAQAIPSSAYLSVNVSPTTLNTGEFLEAMTTGPMSSDRLVVEVTEHASVDDYEAINESLAALRARGVRLAVDDAGVGYSSFRHILRLAPDSIKLDRDVIADIDADPARRAFAAAVVMFALEVGSSVVAEGIETAGELRTVQLLGVDTGQGYLLGRPTSDPHAWPNRDHLFRRRRTAARSTAAAGC